MDEDDRRDAFEQLTVSSSERIGLARREHDIDGSGRNAVEVDLGLPRCRVGKGALNPEMARGRHESSHY